MNKQIIIIMMCLIISACEQSKLNLELDSSVINLINLYINDYNLERPTDTLKSIDLFVYEHPFNSYIMLVKSSPLLSDIPFFITYFDDIKIRVFSSARLLIKDKDQFYFNEPMSKYEKEFAENRNDAVIFDPPFHFYIVEDGQFIRCDIWSCLYKGLPPIPKPTIKYQPPEN